MNTNMTGFSCFQKYLHACALDESMSLNSIGRVSVHFLGLRSQNSQHEMREIMAPPVNRGALQASHHDAISDEGKKPYFGLTFQAWSVPCGKQVFATPPFPLCQLQTSSSSSFFLRRQLTSWQLQISGSEDHFQHPCSHSHYH